MEFNHTFVLCAYKESRYLEKCIKSLLMQSHKSKILISTSTPNAYITNLAEKYNISLYSHLGGGIGKDWNEGLKLVDTKYATIAHQDDIYKEDFLEKVLGIMSEKEDSIIGFSNYQEIKNEKVIPKNKNLRIKDFMLSPLKYFTNSRFIRRRILSLGSPICCPAVTYNLENIGDFTFSETMRVSLDWEAWSRLSKIKGSFCYVPEVLMYHRIHEESETTNAIEDNFRTLEDEYMFNEFWPKAITNLLMKAYKKSQESNEC